MLRYIINPRIILLSILYSFIHGKAQETSTFLTEGKVWNYELESVNVWENNRETSKVSYFICGDTIINENLYKKMYRAADTVVYHGALREDKEKVYLFYGGEELLLYDWGLQKGDSYSLYVDGTTAELTLKAITYQYLHDRNYKIFEFNNSLIHPIKSTFVVEGVGSTSGWNILELYTSLPPSGFYTIENFLDCYENGVLLFSNDDFRNITTKAERMFLHSSEDPSVTMDIYNVIGERLQSSTRNGLFIVRNSSGIYQKIAGFTK